MPFQPSAVRCISRRASDLRARVGTGDDAVQEAALYSTRGACVRATPKALQYSARSAPCRMPDHGWISDNDSVAGTAKTAILTPTPGQIGGAQWCDGAVVRRMLRIPGGWLWLGSRDCSQPSGPYMSYSVCSSSREIWVEESYGRYLRPTVLHLYEPLHPIVRRVMPNPQLQDGPSACTIGS